MIHWLQQSVRDNNHQNHQIFVPPCIYLQFCIYLFFKTAANSTIEKLHWFQTSLLHELKFWMIFCGANWKVFKLLNSLKIHFLLNHRLDQRELLQNFRAPWMSMFLAQVLVVFDVIRFTWENGLPYGSQRVGVDRLILYKHIILHRIMNKLYFTEQTIWNVMLLVDLVY